MTEMIFFRSGNSSLDMFDGVLVCTGRNAEPYIPDIPGISNGIFHGRVLHSQSYKDNRSFEDQNVIVIGAKNSAVDIAVNVSQCAKQVRQDTNADFRNQ